MIRFYNVIKTLLGIWLFYRLKILDLTLAEILINICREKGTQFFPNINKGDIKYFPIRLQDEWQISILKELLQCNFDSIPLSYVEANSDVEYIACS